MKHRELLEMEDLGITDEIRETAYKDQGEERGEEGNWRGIYSYYKYHSYLRAGKQNGIWLLKSDSGDNADHNQDRQQHGSQEDFHFFRGGFPPVLCLSGNPL